MLVPLVEDELNELATAQLQVAFLEATNRLGAFNIEQFLPSSEGDVLALFENVSDRASLKTAIASALNTFNAQDLLASVPNADAVLDTARLAELEATELADLNAAELFERVFSGLGELNAFDLNNFIPADALNGLLETFQTALADGANQVEALQSLVQEAIAAFENPNINLFQNNAPGIADLLNEFLPVIAPDALTDLAAGDIQTSLFTALGELDVLNLDGFISLETAQNLLSTFTSAIAGDPTNIPTALAETLGAALTTPDFLNALAGELPAIDEIVTGLLPELSSVLNGGIGGFLTQLAGIEGIINLDPQAIFQALTTTLTELGVLKSVPELGNDVVEDLVKDLVTTFENQLSNGGSLTDALVSGLQQAFLALDALEVFPLNIAETVNQFETELLPLLQSVDLDALSAADFRSILVEAADAFGGLALQTFLPPDIASRPV